MTAIQHPSPTWLEHHVDTVIVGGGMGGLLAAVTAASTVPGSAVVVLEPHPLGGRARCDQRDGFTFNRGPRALYHQGIADRALRAAGVDTSKGAAPILSGAAALCGGELHRFPGGPLDSMRTTLLTTREKGAVTRLLAALWRSGPETDGTVSEWLDAHDATGTPRAFVEALIRVSTYTNAPELLAAGPALRTARLGIRPGVRYLDGGWQSLVDQLADRATALGVEIVPVGASVVRPEDGRVQVSTSDGRTISAGAVVLAAGGPDVTASLLGRRPTAWGELGPSVTAACLELGVRRPPTRRFALGIDEPLYASTHCPPARLAPEGHAVVHLLRYQPVGDRMSVDEQQARLLGLAASIGVRPEDIVAERFLARMVVTGPLPTGGLDGRPTTTLPGFDGVFLCGDWVGPAGLLLDAVAASAVDAGKLAAARSATMVPA